MVLIIGKYLMSQIAIANIKAKVLRMILSFMVDHERVLRNVMSVCFSTTITQFLFWMKFVILCQFLIRRKRDQNRLWRISSCGISVFAMCNFIFSANFLGALSATAILSMYPHAEGFFKFCLIHFGLVYLNPHLNLYYCTDLNN